MKKVLVAMVCTLGAVACGESRPAESPATTMSTSVTTETTTTRTPASPTARTNAASTSSSNGSTATSPADGLDTTRQLHDSSIGGTGTDNGNGTNAGVGAAAPSNASSSNNPGIADHTKDATNTKINDRDRHGALTPMDQGGGNDRDITAAIRRAVVGDKALSFTAKNVKIITVGGKVTLRGPVKSDEEKSSIEQKAKAATGVSDVDNQLEVKK